MLKTINPLLNADVLHALAAMGHGDYLVLCDAYAVIACGERRFYGCFILSKGVIAPEA